jgi:rhodanese-related sulfurtransferase/rubrerythrin
MIQLRKLFTPVESLDVEQAQVFIKERQEGTYTILDVRQPGEYEEEHIPGAKLIPLPELNDSMEKLDANKPIIVHCAIGGRSRVAAQLLSGQGFKEVYNLKGGIKAWKGVRASGPVEVNLDLVRGDEGSSEIITLAYGMERSLQIFYVTMAEKALDQKLVALFKKLAEVEKHHKKLLFELKKNVDSGTGDLSSFEAGIDPKILEGGFEMKGFMKVNEPYIQTTAGILDIAMMLETQALDLYLRFTDKLSRQDARQVLFKIAQEEKAHLASLGKLMDEKPRAEDRTHKVQ